MLGDIVPHRKAMKNDVEQRVVGSRAAGLGKLVSGEYALGVWGLSTRWEKAPPRLLAMC